MGLIPTVKLHSPKKTSFDGLRFWGRGSGNCANGTIGRSTVSKPTNMDITGKISVGSDFHSSSVISNRAVATHQLAIEPARWFA